MSERSAQRSYLERVAVAVTVAVLLVVGVVLRLRFLDEGSLFIDEGESSLNALSILEHGVPTDHYMGLPMFENTLTEPWPESPEYEFRDTSYSTRGLAIYHGWLPLYTIAASLALHGIGPDHVTDPPTVQHSDEEIHERIRAVRLPSVAFGLLFLVSIFLAGRALYGVDAGLCALLAAALAPKCIWLAQQARYYSAALALTTLAMYCAWRASRRGRWRDFVLAGVVFVLLFHTSSLSFASVVLGGSVLLPSALRREGAPAKLAVFAGLIALGLLPWMLWTGYFEHNGRTPMARTLLSFPVDYLRYFSGRQGRAIGGTALVAGVAVLWSLRRRLPARLAAPIAPAGPAALFLGAWVVAAYLGFQIFVPAASCSMARLSHVLIAAPMLLGSVAIALVARVLWPAGARWLALAGMFGLLLASRNVLRWQHRNPYEAKAVFEMVDHLRSIQLRKDTRLYALPYQQLCMTFYTGLPVQSIAPVRREFLDRYPGEILILETTNRLPQPPWDRVQRLAREQGVRLSSTEATEWVPKLHALMIHAEVAPLVHDYAPDPGPQPEWVAPVVAELRQAAALPGPGYYDFASDNPAMFQGYPPMTMDDFWPVFFYRFVDPEQRRGEHLNYAGRMREAEALMLPSTWIVLCCPARARAGG